MSIEDRVKERQDRKKVRELHLRGSLSHPLLQSFIGPHYRVISTSGFQRAEPVMFDGSKPSERIIFHNEDSLDGSGSNVRLIGAMRNHVKTRLEEGLIRKIEPEDPFLTASNSKGLGSAPADCYELDITAAWFTSAREIGAVSKEFWYRIMRTATKDQRLRMVGALATQRTIQEYKDGKPAGPRVTEYSSPETAPVLNWIRAHTDNMMRRLMKAARKDFLMYFADAIFIRKNKSLKARLVELAGKNGFTLRPARKVYTLTRAPSPYGGALVPTASRKGEQPRIFCMVEGGMRH